MHLSDVTERQIIFSSCSNELSDILIGDLRRRVPVDKTRCFLCEIN